MDFCARISGQGRKLGQTAQKVDAYHLIPRTLTSASSVAILVSSLVATIFLSGCGQKGGPPPGGSPESAAPKATPAPGSSAAEKLADQQPAQVAETIPPGQLPPPTDDARALLEKVVAAYKAAEGYYDRGIVQVVAEVDGNPSVMMQADYQFQFARPNRFRLQCYNGIVVCDGEYLYGRSAALPGQILRRPAPADLSIEAIYADFELSTALVDGPTRPAMWVPIQLLLIAAEDPLKTLLYAAKPPRLLQPQKLEKAVCDRVVIERPDGAITLWIDRETSVVRAVEFPSAPLAASFPPSRVRNVAIVANLAGATLAPPPELQVFNFRVDEGAHVVEELSPPHIRWLGKPLPEFTAVRLDATPLTREDLAGKVAVLEIWATWCGVCRETLPMVEAVHRTYKDSGEVAFWAISVDERDRSDIDLENVFHSLRVTIPIARDPEKTLATALDIAGVPTMLVVGRDGTIEYYQTGSRPDLPAQLQLKLERVLAGQHVYQELLDVYEQNVSQFRKVLAQSIADDLYVFPFAETPEDQGMKIVPRSEPKAFRLEELWTIADIAEPGNFLIVPAGEGKPPQIFVLSGGQEVFELSADGQVLTKHRLSSDRQKPIHFVRSAADAEGKRYFVGWTSPALDLTLFDASWQSILVFPPQADQFPHPGIADVELADVDNNGNLELLVGYWNIAGLQCVSLEGKRLWTNRSLSDALCIVLYEDRSAGTREILSLDTRGGLGGAIARLATDGQRIGEIIFRSRSVLWLHGADLDQDGCTDLCALTLLPEGNLEAIGITLEGEILWQYPLPFGIHQVPIEPVIAAQVTGKPPAQWIIATADGGIHWLNPDGKVLDSFAYGEQLRGVAVADLGEGPVLLVSAASGVTAWQIIPRESTP